MNYTKSGAIAVGSPGSLARITEECRNAQESENYVLLSLTYEGNSVLDKFAKKVGMSWPAVLEYESECPGHIAGIIKKHEREIDLFVSGYLFNR